MKMLEFTAVGDVSLVCRRGRDPFRHVARYLRTSDILFGNLECVLCDAGAAPEREATLRVSPRKAEYLRRAGFTILSVANDHSLDCGPAGLSQTLAALQDRGIRCAGHADDLLKGSREIIECKGLNVGVLAYCENDAARGAGKVVLNRIERDTILEQLADLKPRCDTVIVSLHWGTEHAHYPSPAQIELARDLVMNGAALVLGHHPRVVQGLEEFEASLIAYSLGTFQSEPARPETRRSFILRATISARGIERYKLVPVRIDGENRPRLVWNEERRRMVQFVERISAPIWKDQITERWWFEQIGASYLQESLQEWFVRVRKYGIRHLLQFMRWLVSRFTVKCCLGLLRSRVGLHE